MAAWKWVDVRCAELGVTKKQIADRLGMPYEALIRNIGGYRRPEPDFAERVKKALDEMAAELVGGVA